MAFFVWFSILIVTLYGLGQLAGPWLDQPRYRILFLPGYLLGMVARLIGCQLTYAEIKEIRLLSGDRRVVHHRPPRIPTAGPVILAGLPVMILVSAYFALDVHEGPVFADSALELPTDIPFRLSAIEVLADAAIDRTQLLWDLFNGAGFDPSDQALFLFLATSLLLAAAPLQGEIKPLLLIMLGLIVAARAAEWLGLSFAYLSNGWFLQSFYGTEAWQRFSFLVVYTLFLLLLAGLLRLVVYAYIRLRPRPSEG